MTNIQVVFDILIICLLFPAVVYMIVLNQRIKTLRGQKEDFLKLIAVFNDVTAKAESSLQKIKSIGETSGKNLKELVDQATSLREDLAFMNDRAVLNANNLEKLLRETKYDDTKNKTYQSSAETYGNIDSQLRSQSSLAGAKKAKPHLKYDDNSDEDVLAAIKVAKNVASQYERDVGKKADNNALDIDDDEHTEIERALIRDVFMNIHKKGE